MSTMKLSADSMSSTLKVAVTGSTGFIGRHVLAELAKHSVEVIAIARQLPADRAILPRVRFAELDLQDASSDAFELVGSPDVLIHLAWGGLPNYKSLHHFEKEVPIHYRFLKAMVNSGLRSVFVAGTCFEYGMRSGALSESMETNPSNPYGFAKDALRRQLEYLKAANPFALTWARLFYLYGDGQSENSLHSQLKKAIERGDKEFNMSGGEQLRDYLPVGDAAKHIVALALLGKDIGIVNICSGKPISLRKLAEHWIAENGSEIKLNLGHYPYADYEPMAFWGVRHKLDRFKESS